MLSRKTYRRASKVAVRSQTQEKEMSKQALAAAEEEFDEER
jgi:hypothetical protein